MDDVEFKFIHHLTNTEINQLSKIVGDKENMKELGDGNIWDDEKIKKIIEYSKNDYDEHFKNSRYLYIVIIVKGEVIGIGYIHPGLKEYSKCCVQNAILIDKEHRRKGYGKMLNEELIKMNSKFIKKSIMSFVKINNKSSNGVYKRYKLKGQLMFGKNKYNVYEL